MEQIYYTQCPIGYGLGASNGFQIKRVSAGYPITADFRHFNMRAFVPGSRELAPPVFRYRREESVAEIAWLTPRLQEYETERGVWGRPGGHFTHGVRLDEGELGQLLNWPAGLFDASCRRRSDPVRTLDQEPEVVALSRDDLKPEPEFRVVARLAQGLSSDYLAKLLAATADSADREGTLVLIDRADRIVRMIALLTFVFPAAMRRELTFSTYHDRPEELIGFRLQGTLAGVRLNRAALVQNGRIADIASESIDPPIESAWWARTLAERILKADEQAELTHNRIHKITESIIKRIPIESLWTDARLDAIFGLERAVRRNPSIPTDSSSWARMMDLIRFAAEVGLEREWVSSHDASWWGKAGEVALSYPHARASFRLHGRLGAAWRGGDPAEAGRSWGVVVAPWLVAESGEIRMKWIIDWLRVSPEAAHAPFLAAATSRVPERIAEEIRLELMKSDLVDRRVRLLLGLRGAAEDAIERNRESKLKSLFKEAIPNEAIAIAILGGLDDIAGERSAARRRFAGILADSIDWLEYRAALEWALRLDRGFEWIAPALRRKFADPMNVDDWRKLWRLAIEPLKPVLVRMVLEITRDESLPFEGFCWGVEEALLSLDESVRPTDPAWPGMYLDSIKSDYFLIRKLYLSESGSGALRNWIDGARDRGELNPGHVDRLGVCRGFAEAFLTNDLEAISSVRFPSVFPEDRGDLMAPLLKNLKDNSLEHAKILIHHCASEWPGAFRAGAEGLAGPARAIAPLFVRFLVDRNPNFNAESRAKKWLERVVQLSGWVGAAADASDFFAPNGLIAEIVAETTRRLTEKSAMFGGVDIWPLRQLLIDREETWRCLAVDLRNDLEASVGDDAVERFVEWVQKLSIPSDRPGCLFEIALNVCGGENLIALVSVYYGELNSLDQPIRRWNYDEASGESDDVRERVVFSAPIEPLSRENLRAMRGWLGKTPTNREKAGESAEIALAEYEEDGSGKVFFDPTYARLSDRAKKRWRLIEALTIFELSSDQPAETRWNRLIDSGVGPPSDESTVDERFHFFARLIYSSNDYPMDLVDRIASWIGSSLSPLERLGDWADEFGFEVSAEKRVGSLEFIGLLKRELASREK